MNPSELKGEDGKLGNKGIDHFDERDLPVKFKVALHLLNNLKREQFSDLVFELNGNKFPAHRLVLALWSPVMMNMLSINSCKAERIQLIYDQPEAFQQFITFLYTGAFDGNVTDVLSVLLLASTFQISLLCNLCEEHLLKTVTVTNVISLFHISVHYQLTCLEWQCADYIRQHLPEVAQHSEMRDLDAEQMNSFLGSEHVSKLDQEMKLFLLISWLTEDVPNRQQFLVMLLGHIDWLSVAEDFLTDISQTENFFTLNPSSLYLLLQTLHSSSIALGPYTEQFEQLREEHSYLLNSVVNSSIHLGMGKHSQFRPIALSILTNPRDASSKICEHSDNACDISLSDEQNFQEPLDSEENISAQSPRVEEPIIEEKESGKVNECINRANGNRHSEKINSSIRVTSKVSCEGSMKRKRLRPKKLISGSDNIILSRLNSPFEDLPDKNSKSSKKRGTAEMCGKGKSGRSVTKKRNTRSSNSLASSEHSLEENNKNDSKIKTSGKNRCESNKLSKNKQKIKKIESQKLELQIDSNSKEQIVTKGRSKKSSERPQYWCSKCEFVSASKHLLDRHINREHESRSLFKCPLCVFECKRSKIFNDHLKLHHFNGPPFICAHQDCTYRTEKLQMFMVHRRNHTDERLYVCDICKMSFKRRNNLYAHLKCHNDEKKYKCPVCAKCFKLKNTLDQHVVTHNDLRPYLCDLCGFSTKFQSHLISHKKIHTGDVFPCTFPACNFSTPKRSQLKTHMRSHLGIRHHICGTCGKAFVQKSHLIRHERIHSSVKSHKCSLCDYASNRGDKLREHMIKHERLKLTTRTERNKKKKRKTDIVEISHQTKATGSNDTINTATQASDENVSCDIYITSVRSGDGLSQDQRPYIDSERMLSSAVHYFDHGPEHVNPTRPMSDVQYETLRCDSETNAKMSPFSSRNQQDRGGGDSRATADSTAKQGQGQDLSAMDLLAHIGLSMADIPNSTDHDHHHQAVGLLSAGHYPAAATNIHGDSDNPLTELTEMILPGIDVSPSIFSNNQQPMQQHTSSPPPPPVPRHQSVHLSKLSTAPSPSHSSSSSVYPHHHHHHHHAYGNTNALVHSPHPLSMVPDINSTFISHQPIVSLQPLHSQHPSSDHAHHLDRRRQQQQQEHRQLSNYTQCDKFSY